MKKQARLFQEPEPNVLPELDLKEAETIADVDPAIYNNYVGKYELVKDMNITVSTKENRIFVQVTGQPQFEIFPKSETEYFLKVVNAQITFIRESDGTISSLLLDQAGVKRTAARIK